MPATPAWPPQSTPRLFVETELAPGPLRIRFAHCDPAGIVFFPQYLVMLNGHVEDWFTDGLGLSYADPATSVHPRLT